MLEVVPRIDFLEKEGAIHPVRSRGVEGPVVHERQGSDLGAEEVAVH